MLRSLYARLALALAGLLTLVGVLLLVVAFTLTRGYVREIEQKLHRDLPENLVKEKILMTEDGIDEAALADVFHTLMVVNPRIEVYLLDEAGRVLSFSAPPGAVKLQRVDLGPVRALLEGTTPLPILGDDPRDPGRPKVFSAAPIEVGGQPRGFLYIVLAGQEYESVAEMLRGSYVLRLGLGVSAAVLLFGALAGFVLFHQLTRRLRRLTARVETFRRERLAGAEDGVAAAGAGTGDELERLGVAFDRMAARIVEQIGQLRATDAQRRELVANVSHDLRTPLASLQGYLETLLLKDGLPVETRRHYLEVAGRHAERLGKLVGDLFELAKLESDQVEVEAEPCSLAELVQDVVQKFELTAKQRGVRLIAELRDDLPLVEADIGRIERVLENLLDNALRHTPPEGVVTVGLSEEEGSVGVRVADTGSGIAEPDLVHIFERYYRGRGGGEAHAGLGLAIAKRIVELHGGTLEAASRPGAGSTFSFRLPARR